MQVLKDATLLFSCNSPTLTDVIPGMDYLNKFFATVMADNTTSLAIRAAVGLGKRHLNKYYGLTDTFPACKIALCKSHSCCSVPCRSPNHNIANPDNH